MDHAPTFDLQSHSTYSDGELPPGGVVEAAAAAGVKLLALTDHDSVNGVAEAAAAATRAGIRLIPAVEISTADAVSGDLHICGYAVDCLDPALARRLARAREAREHRAARIVGALQALGWEIDAAALVDRAGSGRAVGRPHIAQATIDQPANSRRLREEGINDATAFLRAYLVKGRPGYVARDAPSVEEAIALIHGAGGVAIWAHPFWNVAGSDQVRAAIDRFRGYGVDGVEAFYITHTEAQVTLLVRECAGAGLLTTGSSDFHGPGHALFNRFRAFSTYGSTANLGRLAFGP